MNSDLQDHPGREAAKALIHETLHGLNVRITDLPGECHCNLIAEVILDALYGRAALAKDDVPAAPLCIRCHERASTSLTGLCGPCDVSGGRASGSGWEHP